MTYLCNMCSRTFIFFVVTLVLGYPRCILSTIPLEELKSINYEVDIGKTPVRITDETSLPTMQVRSKYGQTYQCLLPQIEETENFEKKDTAADDDIDIKELLKPLKIGSCLLKTKDWWTYEFCYGHYIKQYHIEDGKIIGNVINLGLYESDYDWNNETEEHQARFRHLKQRYHSQTYTNGTQCDLTGLPRNAEVRFFCEEDAGDYIYRVDEPGTCSYVITVHTSRLCVHPRLRPMPSFKAHIISCSPLLDEEQYAHYLQKLNEEKIMAESKRNKWLTNQQEWLKVMKTSEDGSVEQDIDEKSESVDKKVDEGFVLEHSYSDESKILPDITSSSHDADVDVIDEDFEKRLLQEYKQEIEKWKSVTPSERFAVMKNHIGKQLDSIIKEAEEDISDHINENSREAILSKLASTLNKLLERLDKAEKEVVRAAQQLHESSAVVGQEAQDNDQGTFSPNVKSDIEDLPPVENGNSNDHAFSGKSDSISGSKLKSSFLDDDKLHIRIRRLDKKSPDSVGEIQEMDFAQRTKLEQAIKEKLEKSGVDTGGRRIEVKIITAGYYDDEDGKDFHTLSDEETIQFQNMIMALLTGQQEAIQEMERHKKLEENYKFVWNSKDQSLFDDDDE